MRIQELREQFEVLEVLLRTKLSDLENLIGKEHREKSLLLSGHIENSIKVREA